jgi:hypothetical protein
MFSLITILSKAPPKSAVKKQGLSCKPKLRHQTMLDFVFYQTIFPFPVIITMIEEMLFFCFC